MKERRNCLLNLIAQNNIKIKFPRINMGTPRLSTESMGNLRGGIWGKRYDNSKAKANNELRIKRNLSKNFSFFI